MSAGDGEARNVDPPCDVRKDGAALDKADERATRRVGAAEDEARRRRSDWTVVGLVAGMFVLGALIAPAAEGTTWRLSLFGFDLPGVCWFSALTGRPCAACGMTRSVTLLLHGRFAASYAQHPFGLLAALMALAALPSRAARLRGRAAAWTIRWDQWWNRAMTIALCGLLLWWAVRWWLSR